MSLSEIIIQRIKADGPISFHDFMEMALYYPELGYYISGNEKIGNNGDYYTSPHFTSLFGEMIGKQIEEMWRLSGGGKFVIVEYGAGAGALCCHVMDYIRNNTPVLYELLDYCIIEKSSDMRRREQAVVHEKVRWCNSIKDISGFHGCVISNELLDNFSVHRVVMGEELMEVYVDHNEGFTEVLRPASTELKAYLSQLNVDLPRGFRTEVNLEAIQWLNEIAASIGKGFVMTIDYGYPSSELYDMRRRAGTLVCYKKHRVNDDPYADIGEQDITAHVNFSALCHWGTQNGLQYCGYTDQRNFLQALGITDHLRKQEQNGKSVYADIRDKAFLIHTLLMDMGSKFKVLIQQKGIEQPILSGMQFSRQLV